VNPWGWFEERGKAAADALIRRHQKGLAVLVARICASYPWDCILTYEKIAELIAGWHGRKPHRESVGRVVRLLAARGLLTKRRIFPGQRLPGLRFLSAHGTTAKDFPFRQLGERDPIPTSQRRRVRHRLREKHRGAVAELATELPQAVVGPKHSSPVVAAGASQRHALRREDAKPKRVDPELQKMFDEGFAHFEALEAAQDEAMLASVKRHRGPL
jgi:hypothetical protein